jgi:hypothetical protein
MGEKLDKFLAGSSKPLQLASLGFGIMVVGGLVGFLTAYMRKNVLGYIAAGLCFLGFFLGCVAGVWNWSQILRRDRVRRGGSEKRSY